MLPKLSRYAIVEYLVYGVFKWAAFLNKQTLKRIYIFIMQNTKLSMVMIFLDTTTPLVVNTK